MTPSREVARAARWTALLALLTSCSTVAETGRRRIAWLPESYMSEIGAAAYDEETSAKYPVIRSGPDHEMVQRIGKKIAEASRKDYAWEFRLLDAKDVVNAFCLPGGKVAVYTGLLKVTQNEDALACVMGHEVAHATAEHGNERMTQGIIQSGVLSITDAALQTWSKMSDSSRASTMEALGIASQLGAILPFSREHESEADEIGLRYMIRAGYDPHEAPKLWARMAAASKDRPPEFLSSHPDPENRQARLERLIPKLLAEEKGKRMVPR